MNLNKFCTCWVILFRFGSPSDWMVYVFGPPSLNGWPSSLGLCHCSSVSGRIVRWCWLLNSPRIVFHLLSISHQIMFWKTRIAQGDALFSNYRAKFTISGPLDVGNDHEGRRWVDLSPNTLTEMRPFRAIGKWRHDWVLFGLSFPKRWPIWIRRPRSFALLRVVTIDIFLSVNRNVVVWLALRAKNWTSWSYALTH